MSDRAAAPLTPGPRPATPKLPQGPQLCGGHATECPPLRPNAGHRAQFASQGAEAWVWKGAVGTAVVGGAGQRRGSLLPTLLAKGLRRRNYPACVQRGLISHGPICCWGGGRHVRQRGDVVSNHTSLESFLCFGSKSRLSQRSACSSSRLSNLTYGQPGLSAAPAGGRAHPPGLPKSKL